MVCYYIRYHSESTILWMSPLVNSSDFALRATTGQEGWGPFCHVVGPSGPAVAVRRESRRTSDPALSRIRGKRLQLHP
jgi:hypothetical protein